MTELDGAAVREIAELAYTAAEQPTPIELVPGHSHGIVLQPGQSMHTYDVGKYNQIPHRKTGTVKHRDVESFAQYVNRHRDERGTTLWANATAGTLTAVLNDHEEDAGSADTAFAGWGDHRAILTVEHTPDWIRWLGADGKLVDQATFAEHLEDLAHTIIRPQAAEMVELAQHFQAARNVDFESARRLDSGEVQLMYRETISATAGRGSSGRGSIAIPDEILIAVEPFAGSERVELVARFRYRLAEATVKLGYRLVRPDKARDDAFAALVEDASSRVQLDAMHGTPRG